MTIDIEPPRILFVDSYDSFTFNLASLCRRAIPECAIHIIKNDQAHIDELLPTLGSFSAIVVGPGPGSPNNPRDVGVIKDLWKLSEADLLPIFGVCLGHQSLAVEYGAEVRRLEVVKHGQVSKVLHKGNGLFEGIGETTAVRYHSLHVHLAAEGDIEPLAWADDGFENGTVLMAARHKHRPFWSVQYHPESALTDGGGLHILQNFWKLACQWSRKRERRQQPLHTLFKAILGPTWPHLSPSKPSSAIYPQASVSTSMSKVHLPVNTICERLGVFDENTPFVLLESAAKPGRYSIIGSLLPDSIQILYSVGDTSVTIRRGTARSEQFLGSGDIWSWLGGFMRSRSAVGGSPDVPFWGGLIGLLSYELGVTSLSVPLRPGRRRHNKHRDVNLVYVERSVVVDHHTHTIYVQSTLPDDELWISQTLESLTVPAPHEGTACLSPPSKSATVTLPDRSQYISRIEKAKEFLFSGDSYELCLTANTRVQAPRDRTSWERYKALRRTNPAPHSAYLRLHPSTFLSSSPERFLSYSRPPGSLCQLRPIKGTMRKAPGVTRAHAEEALRGSCKEVAENLMIVDLIRHDLHGVVGLDVDVKQFCGIEEYETVWQMVSVIEGKLPTQMESDGQLGLEVLKSSLPPGSMTGAPKKRSVEILQILEDQDRSLYSGVFGYWCVGGSGDWSVAIRSCFRHQEDDAPVADQEEWVIGAGGAITALSEPEAEWNEMVTKLQSALGAFGTQETRCPHKSATKASGWAHINIRPYCPKQQDGVYVW
ncbi:para-aminobenzoate synthase, (PABA) [Marasmius tenuissimus]|uniref:aminodeoxychorismate synthase n=1 Tax=Marasmius tenuissimus TaxID=585030 RepID=A0ABR3A5R3_9AGAR